MKSFCGFSFLRKRHPVRVGGAAKWFLALWLLAHPGVERLMAIHYLWDVHEGDVDQAHAAAGHRWDLMHKNWSVGGDVVAWANAEDRKEMTGASFRWESDNPAFNVITVDKSSLICATVLSFSGNGYVLKGDEEGTELALSSAKNSNAIISIYPGKVTTIGDRLTVAVQGTFQVTGQKSKDADIGELVFEKGSLITSVNNMTINGASVRFNAGSRLESSLSGAVMLGDREKEKGSTLTVDGGHLRVGGSHLTVGCALPDSRAVTTLTLISGVIETTSERPTAGELRFGLASSAAGTGFSVVNLFGGTLTVARVCQTQPDLATTLNLDGGTLRVKAPTAYADHFLEGLNAVYVGSKGGRIDTNGVDVTVGQALLGNGNTGANSIDGGLTKVGLGRLMLSGRNSFTGPLKVEAGEVRLIGGGTLVTSSGFEVAQGAVLNLVSGMMPPAVGSLRGAGAIELPAGRGLRIYEGGTLTPGDRGGDALTVRGGGLMLDDGVGLEIGFGLEGDSVTNSRIVLRGRQARVIMGGNYRLKLTNNGGVKPDGLTFVLIDSEVPMASTGTWEIDYGNSGWTDGAVVINPVDQTQLILSGLKSRVAP